MRTPFVANTRAITHDEKYGMMVGSLFLENSACHYSCDICNGGGLEKAACMELDEVVKLIAFYRIKGVEMIEVRGGEPTLLLSVLEPSLDYISEELPVRFVTSGSRPHGIDALRGFAEGFRIEIRTPLSYPRGQCRMTDGDATTSKEFRFLLAETMKKARELPASHVSVPNIARWKTLDQRDVSDFCKEHGMSIIEGGKNWK